MDRTSSRSFYSIEKLWDKQLGVRFSCVCPLDDQKLRHNIVQVTVAVAPSVLLLMIKISQSARDKLDSTCKNAI